ncbi:hypothetical protein AWENTII_001306 [Aspergillus wentii]
MSMSDLASKVKQFGLTQVYCSVQKPLVDIVFVHGLNGNPYNSWTSKSTGTFWPADLLPEVLDVNEVRVRVLTYGYNANVHSFTDGASKDRIHNHAETLASGLAANRNLRGCSDRPIIFVCHSLGGLVVKRALIYCRSVSNEKIEHLRSIFVSTYGILFLGTPHNGSDVAKWGLLLQNICSAVMPKKFMESSPQLVEALRSNNETLQNINSLFADVMGRFHIYFFHETRSTDVKGTRELIVDESSAAPYAEGTERMGIEADHSHMCKFDDENSPGYEAVAEALLRYSRDAPDMIADRWVEEKRTRLVMRQAKASEIFHEQRVDGPMINVPDRPSMIGTLSPPDRMTASLPDPRVLAIEPPPNEPPSHIEPLLVAPPGFHPNATFVGMQKELDILHARLFKAKKRAERLVAVLICGVPGSGKSHLARQYVWTYRENYPGGIFWVDSKSRESISKCFWDIAQAATLTDGGEFQHPDSKAPQKYVEVVRNWFQAREEWLLVFDGITFNHDGDLNHFKQFLPFNKKCSIIYTSVDKTLRKKQRLYEPYCLVVPSLTVEDACKLLFKDLAIKTPTREQARKATDLVNHYEGLPLAIHAISHRLSATSKPIEKYHINSHLTDEKLAEPFLGIMHDLFRLEHHQALNLINLLSFFGHHVPVGMLLLGKAALETWNMDILASSRPGERGEIDTTLGILIRYGLIERTTDTYSLPQTSFSQKSDGDDTVDMKAIIPDLSESQTESSQDAFFAVYQNSGTIDVIKIHGVVQGFCRDELKIMDEERKATKRPSGDTGFYDSWLLVATRVFCKSYENAKHKMQCSDDRGLVRDYREYETHACRLLQNFPKKSTASSLVREARDDLRQVIKSIGKEIENISPSSSQESLQKHRSVFDRTSSSSSSVPGSSADEAPSRQLTWDFNDEDSPKVESPQQEIPVSQQHFNLRPFPPHIYRESSLIGYEADEEPGAFVRTSPALSQMSQVTEKPIPAQEPDLPHLGDERDWKLVPPKPRSTKGRQSKRRSKFPRNIHGPEPAAPILHVSPVEGRSASSGSLGKGRRGSQVSATESLAAMHAASPPLSRGGSGHTVSTVNTETTQPPSDKENVPTYATVAAKRAHEIAAAAKPRSSSTPGGRHRPTFLQLQSKSSTESLRSRASNAQASPLASEFRPDQMSQSTYSEPSQNILAHRLNALDLRTSQGSQVHSHHLLHHPSAMRHSEPLPQLPYDNNIEITVSRRLSAASRKNAAAAVAAQAAHNLGSVTHPSAIMPGVSPPPSMTPDVPGGYASEPAPEPMTRNPSGQSHQSWSTEPVRYPPPRFSPMPPPNTGIAQAALPTALPQIIPQQHTISGTGGWIGDIQPQQAMGSAIQPDTSYAAQTMLRSSVPLDNHLKGLDYGLEPEPAPTLHFGGHQVDVRDAQQRLFGLGRFHAPRQVPAYQLYHPNLSGPLIQHEVAVPSPETYAVRARSGSSPSPPVFDGLGLHLG